MDQKWRGRKGKKIVKVSDNKVGKKYILDIAGLRNKDRDVGNFLEAGDFISLCETWIEENSIKIMEKNMSKKFTWFFIPAVKEKRKGRARGGFIISVKKEWVGKEQIKVSVLEEGLIRTELKTKEGCINIWFVYNSGNVD